MLEAEMVKGSGDGGRRAPAKARHEYKGLDDQSGTRVEESWGHGEVRQSKTDDGSLISMTIQLLIPALRLKRLMSNGFAFVSLVI